MRMDRSKPPTVDYTGKTLKQRAPFRKIVYYVWSTIVHENYDVVYTREQADM